MTGSPSRFLRGKGEQALTLTAGKGGEGRKRDVPYGERAITVRADHSRRGKKKKEVFRKRKGKKGKAFRPSRKTVSEPYPSLKERKSFLKEREKKGPVPSFCLPTFFLLGKEKRKKTGIPSYILWVEERKESCFKSSCWKEEKQKKREEATPY